MPSALVRRVARLECAQPAQNRLLELTKMPIAEWPEEVLADFLEAMGEEGPSATALLRALSTSNLEGMIQMLSEIQGGESDLQSDHPIATRDPPYVG